MINFYAAGCIWHLLATRLVRVPRVLRADRLTGGPAYSDEFRTPGTTSGRVRGWC